MTRQTNLTDKQVQIQFHFFKKTFQGEGKCIFLSLSETTVITLRLKCDCTRAETRFRLSAKRTSPFKAAGLSVQSTTVNRDVCISGSNAGYTTFRGSVRVLATHSRRQFPFTSPPVRHRVPSHFNWTLQIVRFT